MIYKRNIIVGPCSAESREQVLQTAKELKDNGFAIFRAGVWKPRTKPGGFEGIGEPALSWLHDVHTIYGMQVGCEVGNADQCKLAMDYDMDYIWIGARTSADPFAVQQMADVIANHPNRQSTMVFVKNPVCPDYDLWLGAIERIKNAMPMAIGAIFRGFKTYDNCKYRNNPIWDILLKMRTEHPEISLYVDPSHIAGDTEYIKEIMDIAHNSYGIDKFMIESHYNPSCAWTDASQQLTPNKVSSIINDIRKEDNKNISTTEELDPVQKELSLLRKEIDYIDSQLLQKLYNRLSICRKIGEFKKDNNIPTFQGSRWHDVLKRIKNEANTVLNCHGELDYFIDNIWNLIHSESIKIQNKEFTNIK